MEHVTFPLTIKPWSEVIRSCSSISEYGYRIGVKVYDKDTLCTLVNRKKVSAYIINVTLTDNDKPIPTYYITTKVSNREIFVDGKLVNESDLVKLNEYMNKVNSDKIDKIRNMVKE